GRRGTPLRARTWCRAVPARQPLRLGEDALVPVGPAVRGRRSGGRCVVAGQQRRPARLSGRRRGGDDRVRDLADRVLAEARGGEELLGPLLRAREDERALGTGPLQRLLDLGAGRVGELGGLVA